MPDVVFPYLHFISLYDDVKRCDFEFSPDFLLVLGCEG